MTKPAAKESRPDGTVVLRARKGQLAQCLGPLGVLAALFVSVASAGHPSTSAPFLRPLALLLVLEAAVILLGLLRLRVILGAETIELRRMFRTTIIAAADIQSVADSSWGSRPITIWTADGRSHTHRLLTGADLLVVGEWWLAHRGEHWQQSWPTAPPPQSRITWWA